MAIVYRPSDRITLKIKDVEFKISPLTYAQKVSIQTSLSKQGGEKMENIAKTTMNILKYSVKEVKGISFADGEKFEIELDESNNMTEECLDTLLNIEYSDLLGGALMQLMVKIDSKIIDPNTGKALDGIKVILPKAKGVPVKK